MDKDALMTEARGARSSFVSIVVTVLGGQAGCALVALVTEVCYAWLLGPEGRGQISVCLMAIAFGVLLGGMGGEGAIILWRADPRKRSTVWLPAVLLWGLIGCVITCSLWALLYWRWNPAFLRGVDSTLAVIVFFSIPVGVLLDYQIAMLVGEERFRVRAGIALTAQVAGLAGFAALLLFGRNAAAALRGNLLGTLAGAVIAAAILKRSFRSFWRLGAARENLLPTLSYAMRGQFGNVASFFNYRLDVFIANYFLGATQVGLYALGVAISEALWQIPAAAALALFPRTARTVDRGAAEFTCLIMRQVFVIAAAGAITIGIGSWLFLPLVFGERFRPSIAIVWLLLPGTLALSLGRVSASDLAGRGKSGYSSVFSITALVVTVVLDLILIPRVGIRGAALASSAAYCTNAVLILAALKYELKTTWRSLLLPTRAEWASYQQAWSRFREWIMTASAIPSRQPE